MEGKMIAIGLIITLVIVLYTGYQAVIKPMLSGKELMKD